MSRGPPRRGERDDMSEPVKRFKAYRTEYGPNRTAMNQIVECVLATDHDAAIAALTLTWREEKPDKEGWYWYRDDENDDEPMIVKVWLAYFDGEPRWYAGDETSGIWIHGPCYTGQWAGPLATPQDGTREG